MSSAPTEQQDEVAHGHHDPAAEIEHARHHAVENNWFFLTFFCVVGLAVISYEFTANGPLEIAILALIRCGLIIGFLFSLFKRFSLLVVAFLFTALFFAGMVYLSMWDSTLAKVGDPITIKSEGSHH
jgi:hypothetical protein